MPLLDGAMAVFFFTFLLKSGFPENGLGNTIVNKAYGKNALLAMFLFFKKSHIIF